MNKTRPICWKLLIFVSVIYIVFAGERHDAGAVIVREIKLEAFQFGFSPDPVVVKIGNTVRLEITSRDVPHGVYIKEYGINIPIKKGENKTIEFLADTEGEFNILCSVFCGSGHSKMKGKLIVEE